MQACYVDTCADMRVKMCGTHTSNTCVNIVCRHLSASFFALARRLDPRAPDLLSQPSRSTPTPNPRRAVATDPQCRADTSPSTRHFRRLPFGSRHNLRRSPSATSEMCCEGIRRSAPCCHGSLLGPTSLVRLGRQWAVACIVKAYWSSWPPNGLLPV